MGNKKGTSQFIQNILECIFQILLMELGDVTQWQITYIAIKLVLDSVPGTTWFPEHGWE